MPTWMKMADFSITLPDRPGQLAQLAARFRLADVSLLGLWGYGTGGGPARFYCVPESAEQFRNFAQSADLQVQEGLTFYVSGTNRGASLVETLEKIAAAGINLIAIQGVAHQGDFGCFIWAESRDWPHLEALLDDAGAT